MESKTGHYICSSLNNGIKSSDQFLKSSENRNALIMNSERGPSEARGVNKCGRTERSEGSKYNLQNARYLQNATIFAPHHTP